MGGKIKKQRKRKAASRGRVRKTQRKRHNPKKNSRKKSVRKSKSKRRRPIRKSRRSTVSGYSTRKRLDSRIVGLGVERIRKETHFSPPLKIPRGSAGVRLLKKVLTPIAMRHFKTIGNSHKNFWYIRFIYSFKYDKKDVTTGFSIGITKLKTPEQFKTYLFTTIEAFIKSLTGYSREGFQQIRFEGIQVQGYYA